MPQTQTIRVVRDPGDELAWALYDGDPDAWKAIGGFALLVVLVVVGFLLATRPRRVRR